MTDLNVTSYRDPITREQRVAYLCKHHETNALRVLRHAGVGSSSTLAPGLVVDLHPRPESGGTRD